MDELEFTKRLYANPKNLEQELLDAAGANPAYQKILDDTLNLEASLDTAVNSTEIPADMMQRLLAIPESTQSEAIEQPSNVSQIGNRKQSVFQYYAIAASLVLAVGILFSLTSGNNPSAADIAFGNEMLAHLHHDNTEIDDLTGGEFYAALDMDEVNVTMANAGTRLVSYDESGISAVRSAKPCEILPAFESAHLVLLGSKGAISVIVINNSPVDVQFNIRDDRFDGIVLPLSEGNMILVGEKDEDLSQYATLFSENVEWVI